MNSHKRRPDGDLPAAKRRLADAVAALTDAQTAWIDHGRKRRKYHAPSLLGQLVDLLGGEQGTGWNGAPQSQPPVYVDAADLIAEIDVALTAWGCGLPELRAGVNSAARLHQLTERPWRPQDVRNIDQIAGICEQWAAQITTLLDPEHVKNIRTPNGLDYACCPQCGNATTYRSDPADPGGKPIRVPALQFVAETGTTCIICKTHWEPAHTLLLGQVLGFELPEGVLE